MKNWGQKLIARFIKDTSLSRDLVSGHPLLTIQQRLSAFQYYDNLGGEALKQKQDFEGRLMGFVEGFDPTPQKAYVTWIIREYAAKRIARFEDFHKAESWIGTFHHLKGRGYFKRNPEAVADIGRLDFQQLGDFIVGLNAQEMMSNGETEAAIFAEQVDVLIDNDELLVAIPRTQDAAVMLGRNTQWCTASTDSRNYYESYAHQGPLYFVLQKKTNRRWQLHFESASFMDERDQPLDWKEFPMAAFNAIDFTRVSETGCWVSLGHYEGDELPPEAEIKLLARLLRDAVAGTMIRSAAYPMFTRWVIKNTEEKIVEPKAETMQGPQGAFVLRDYGKDALSFLASMGPKGLEACSKHIANAFGIIEDESLYEVRQGLVRTTHYASFEADARRYFIAFRLTSRGHHATVFALDGDPQIANVTGYVLGDIPCMWSDLTSIDAKPKNSIQVVFREIASRHGLQIATS